MNYLKEKLIEKHMSQSELARRIGTSPQYVGYLVRGEKPSLNTAFSIAIALDLDLKEFIDKINNIEKS